MLLILLCILFLILISINLFKYREGGFFKRAGSSIRSASGTVNRFANNTTTLIGNSINNTFIRPAMSTIKKFAILGRIRAQINSVTGDLVRV